VDPSRTLAVSALQTLLFLGRVEEKRLRAILADSPRFLIEMRTRSELERLVKRIRVQSEEFEKLQAEDSQV